MRTIREQLGEEAIIVSTQKGENGGVRVTAALDMIDDLDDPVMDHHHGPVTEDMADLLAEALERHNVPGRLTDRLLRTAGSLHSGDPVLALAGALDTHFRFAPLPENDFRRPVMLIGPPGAGKTLAIAKLATRAVMSRRQVNVITTDVVKAGGVEQLQALTSVLKLHLNTAHNPADLKRFCGARADRLQLIDTAGINPFDKDDVAGLKAMIDAVGAEVVLVLPAGCDAGEAAEIADSLKTLSITRLLATRLDMARRLGFMLVAAEIGQFRFSYVSTSPQVAEGLAPINPVSLARLLLPAQTGIDSPHYGDRAFG
ncbi:MAG: hypothetical protein KJ904_13245 [Alphaproteobacteria bacterium]|nr:hypothetical protein [Alphaproteobacteria bacterium]MBU0797133.1 hypothetical protein [Alphaproteobacteria bacterium]MBU0888120.1 hypothetical protein [Alphaproteobacteria bacterium]MBU1811565.1 hypothetical protein [Alphaproteobacteria bacterium]